MAANIYVDEHVYNGPADGAEPLAETIRRVRGTFNDARRVVVAVECDGLDITGERFDESIASRTDTYRRIDLTTGTSGRLVTDAMEHTLELLDDAAGRRTEVVHMLSAGKTVEAMNLLGECFGVWQHVTDAVGKSLAMLDLDPRSVEIDGRSLDAVLAEPMEQLTNIREALESQDHVLLTDVLNYEFDSFADTWKAIIARVIELAGEQNSAGNA